MVLTAGTVKCGTRYRGALLPSPWYQVLQQDDGLYDAASGTYRKPHIRYAWLKCGLIDDFHKVMKQGKDGWYTPQIWRVEFSIRSS